MKKNTKNGKVNDKVVLAILAVIIIAVIILLVVTNANKEGKNQGETDQTENQGGNVQDPEDPNDPNKVTNGRELAVDAAKQPHKYGVYTFSDLKIETSSRKSRIIGSVTAESNQTIPESMLDLNILDEKQDVIATLGVLVPEIQPGETVMIDAAITKDISAFSDYSIHEYTRGVQEEQQTQQ